MTKNLLLFIFQCIAFGLFAQVSKTVNLTSAGALSTLLTATELQTVTNLTITGTIDARDFKTMRDDMPVLAKIDIGSASIVFYSGDKGTTSGSVDHPANAIPAYAFESNTTYHGKTSLTTIILPKQLSTIKAYAFESCSGLSSIDIPPSVTKIEGGAFGGCNRLTSITIPASVNSIGSQAFGGCSGVINVDVNNENYSSLNGVLYNKLRTKLIQYLKSVTKSFTIPSSVTSIGNFAFDGCSELTSVVIPSSVTLIESGAFSGCGGLTTITIPSSVTSIGGWAFDHCSNLSSINIPSSVVLIGSGAFSGCSRLSSIFASNPVPVDLSSTVFPMDYVFYQVDQTTCILYVPIGSKIGYQTSAQWRDFKNIVEKDFTGIEPIGNRQQLSVLPNPTSGKVKLVFDQISKKGIYVVVTDMAGKIIRSRLIQNMEEWIDLSGNAPGVYLLRTNLENFKVQKLIIE